MTTTYLHGITDPATHRVATGRSADQVEADAKDLALWTVTPDRWFPGDLVLLASRDGEAFTGEVADVCVTTGRVIVILNGDGPEACYISPGSPGRRRPRSAVTMR